jgi:hypothetical protein
MRLRLSHTFARPSSDGRQVEDRTAGSFRPTPGKHAVQMPVKGRCDYKRLAAWGLRTRLGSL